MQQEGFPATLLATAKIVCCFDPVPETPSLLDGQQSHLPIVLAVNVHAIERLRKTVMATRGIRA